EHIPPPKILQVILFSNGVPVAPGSNTRWATTSIGWKLGGDFLQNRLEMTIKDEAGKVRRGPQVLRPADDPKSEGANKPDGAPLGGHLFFELRLINKDEKLADGPKTTDAILDAPPKLIRATIHVVAADGSDVDDAHVT